MVMVKQYRKPAERVMLEAPAGKIDPGEEAFNAAVRELKEETGYTAGKVTKLTEFYPSVGYSQEVLHLYLCTELTAGETCPDENEALDVLTVDVDELFKMIMNCEIRDAKTIIAIMMVKELIASGQIQAGKK